MWMADLGNGKYKNPILDMAVLNAEVKNQARKYIGLI